MENMETTLQTYHHGDIVVDLSETDVASIATLEDRVGFSGEGPESVSVWLDTSVKHPYAAVVDDGCVAYWRPCDDDGAFDTPPKNSWFIRVKVPGLRVSNVFTDRYQVEVVLTPVDT